MTSSPDELARQAAQRLAPEVDRNLPALVEAQIQAGGQPPERYDPGTAIALAALLLRCQVRLGHLQGPQEGDKGCGRP